MTRYLIIFALLALLSAALCIPVHSLPSENIMLLSAYPKSQGKILIFGNSVNGTISKCDSDTRTLPALAAADAGMPIVNLSRGGMTLGQMLQLAETGARSGVKPATMIFPISPEAGFFRSVTVAHGLRAFLNDNLGTVPGLGQLLGAPEDGPPPTAYRGKQYGDYGEFSKQYFPVEKVGAGCPNGAGINRPFVQFMYWRNFLQMKDPMLGFDELLPRIERLRQKQIDVVFWMMPVNFGDLRALHGDDGVGEVKKEIAEVRSGLEQHGFTVLDSSELVASSGFTDRWCACGHLAEEGRKIAAFSLSGWIAHRARGGQAHGQLTAAD